MKPSTMKNLLTELIPAKENILLVGSPGVGKTDVVTQATRELGHNLLVWHPVVDDPVDYKGMPAIVDRNGEPSAQFLPFGNLWELIETDEPTVVFFDDIGQAPGAVQASLMQLVLARRINGHKISDKVSFVAATNRRQDQAAVTGLITPLLDRFTTVLTLDFDLDDWVLWALNNEMPAELIAFARFRSDLMGKFEANRDMKKSPTPRSIAGMGRLFKRGIHDYEVLSGAVGEGFATEFLAFYRTWSELPDRMEIYMNPDTVPVPEKTDVLYALMGSLAFGAEPGNIEQTMRYLERVPAEFRVLCIKDAIVRNPEVKRTRSFLEWVMSNKELFGYEGE